MSKEDSKIEIVPRTEIIYEDMKLVTVAEPKFNWGQIYHMLKDKKVQEASLEYLIFFITYYDQRLRKYKQNRSCSLSHK